MKSSAATFAPMSYYEGLAEELQSIAEAVRNRPQLSQHFAERLEQLAKQMREDAKLVRITRQS